ncbi:MAG: hypothetical protein R3E08_11770 [Thiotrichaceae bacterium]
MEIRIFPLLNLAGQVSSHVAPVMAMLKQQQYQAQIVTVAYQFQRGGNQMLRITR